jgi:hypothetical protein
MTPDERNELRQRHDTTPRLSGNFVNLFIEPIAEFGPRCRHRDIEPSFLLDAPLVRSLLCFA